MFLSQRIQLQKPQKLTRAEHSSVENESWRRSKNTLQMERETELSNITREKKNWKINPLSEVYH